MTRAETTAELTALAEARMRRWCRLWAPEVEVPGDGRVDFMGFQPYGDRPDAASIERGKLVCCEVKSCMDDFNGRENGVEQVSGVRGQGAVHRRRAAALRERREPPSPGVPGLRKAAAHREGGEGVTADEARERIGDIRAELRRAMRLLCKPGVDWDAAAGWLYRAEMECRRLACDCVRQGVEEDSNDY